MTSLCYDDSMLESYGIRIRKDALKFAASHMTVFPDGSKGALHGLGNCCRRTDRSHARHPTG
jgi:hypothetical protein